MELDNNGVTVLKVDHCKNVEEDCNGDEVAVEEEDKDKEVKVDDDREEEEAAPRPSRFLAQPELMCAEHHELKKKQVTQQQAKNKGPDEDDEDVDLINPNYIEKKLNISDLGAREMTHRERDAKEKQEATDQYWKLHIAGNTDEAKSDLTRLVKIREEHEAAQAKHKADAEGVKDHMSD